MQATLPIRLGTRASRLALAQAEEARVRLAAAHPELARPGAVELVPMRTAGDRATDRPLAEIGGKGLFTAAIEAALGDGRVDMAVHSMKDVPTFLPDGFLIAGLLPREDPRDALVGRAESIAALPRRAVVGTSSLRRRAQLLAARPDLEVVSLRGNVETRLRKVDDGAVQAAVLALAGLRRLGLADRAAAVLEPDEMLPAVAQGAIGVEVRAADARARALAAAIDDPGTALRVRAERAVLEGLAGSCSTPVGVFAELAPEGMLRLRTLLAAPDGGAVFRAERRGPAADGVAMGRDAAAELRAQAGPELCRALGLGGA